MDLRNHENRLDKNDAGECSNASPAGHQNVADLSMRSIAMAQEAGDGPGKFGKMISRDKGIEPMINIKVPTFGAHLLSIDGLPPKPLHRSKEDDLYRNAIWSDITLLSEAETASPHSPPHSHGPRERSHPKVKVT